MLKAHTVGLTRLVCSRPPMILRSPPHLPFHISAPIHWLTQSALGVTLYFNKPSPWSYRSTLLIQPPQHWSSTHCYDRCAHRLCPAEVKHLRALGAENQLTPSPPDMPYRDSPSPAGRPQLADRTLSAQSLSRGSPTSTLHKGSSHKPHKTHAVGHGHNPHGRVPSYGKNLNKLSKLASARPGDGHARPSNHSSTKVQTLATSPPAQNMKRSSSGSSLPRAGSKVSVKRNSSNLSQKRNVSSTKLGKPTKSQPLSHLRHDSANDVPLQSKARFSVGSQDEEWTEASSSQSPATTRQSSLGLSKPRQSVDPPSPDDPPARSPTNLPHSPPQSPPTNGAVLQDKELNEQQQNPSTHYSCPPDAEVVTKRLLNRHASHSAAPRISSISATVTPSGSNGSPSFNFGHDTTPNNEPSMPADGISRFLHSTGSSSGSATPASVDKLQSTLANFHRTHDTDQHDCESLQGSPPVNGHLEAVRRAKSAANLSHPGLTNGSGPSALPPQAPQPNHTRASPFESARDPREAAKSLTQLKLDLQRISTNREPAHAPAVQPPLAMMHGANAVAGLGTERSAERRVRQWEQAELEFRNGRRFHDMLAEGVARLDKRSAEKKKKKRGRERDDARGGEEQAHAGAGSRPPSRPSSRGRVRFEIGTRDGDNEEEAEDEGEGGVEGLLRRMWVGNGSAAGVED